jgi:chromosome segregation ATPase
MRDNSLETLAQERESLSLHVDLCAQRYHQLIAKFEEVDSRLKGIDATLGEIKSSIENHTTVNYLKWAGSAIFVLSMALIGLVTKLLAN